MAGLLHHLHSATSPLAAGLRFAGPARRQAAVRGPARSRCQLQALALAPAPPARLTLASHAELGAADVSEDPLWPAAALRVIDAGTFSDAPLTNHDAVQASHSPQKGRMLVARRDLPPYTFLGIYPGYVFDGVSYGETLAIDRQAGRPHVFSATFFELEGEDEDGAEEKGAVSRDPRHRRLAACFLRIDPGDPRDPSVLAPRFASEGLIPLANEPSPGQAGPNVMAVRNFRVGCGRLEYWTCGAVKAGEELLVCYGRSYAVQRSYDIADVDKPISMLRAPAGERVGLCAHAPLPPPYTFASAEAATRFCFLPGSTNRYPVAETPAVARRMAPREVRAAVRDDMLRRRRRAALGPALAGTVEALEGLARGSADELAADDVPQPPLALKAAALAAAGTALALAAARAVHLGPWPWHA